MTIGAAAAIETPGVNLAPVVVEQEGLLDGSRRALTIGLVLIVTLVAFEALAVATVMPSAQRELGGLRLYGWTFSAFLLASLVGITAAGEQADERGPARPFIAGVMLFGAGLLIAGCAPSMLVLVAGRAVQGLGAGAIPAVVYATIARRYDESLRPRMFAVMASAWVVPGLIGPAISGAVAQYASWRLVFVGLLPIVALAAALTLPALRTLGASPAPQRGERRVMRSIRLALGAGLALGGVSASLVIAVPLVVAGVAIALPALWQLVPRGTLRAAQGLPAAIAGMGLLNLAFFGADAFVPLMLTSLRHQSTLFAGFVLTTATLTWTAGSWVQARLAGRCSRASIVRAGLALLAIGIAGVAIVLSPAVPVLLAAPAWSIAGLGIGLAYPSFGLIVLSSAPTGQEGSVSSSMKLSEVLGAATGIGIGGAIIAAAEAGDWQRWGTGVVFALLASVAIVGVAAASRLPRRS